MSCAAIKHNKGPFHSARVKSGCGRAAAPGSSPSRHPVQLPSPREDTQSLLAAVAPSFLIVSHCAKLESERRATPCGHPKRALTTISTSHTSPLEPQGLLPRAPAWPSAAGLQHAATLNTSPDGADPGLLAPCLPPALPPAQGEPARHREQSRKHTAGQGGDPFRDRTAAVTAASIALS